VRRNDFSIKKSGNVTEVGVKQTGGTKNTPRRSLLPISVLLSLKTHLTLLAEPSAKN
jgi:hypothetical protein